MTDTPQKLHKILAQSGLGSRREMETRIANGEVKVNGVVATLGTRIDEEARVTLAGRPVRLDFAQAAPRILLYHKPEGEIVSRHDPDGRPSVFDALPRLRGAKWVSIGRLDFNTSGLLIFTTSGELAHRLTHPGFEVEREYAVRVVGQLSEEQQRRACQGIELEDGMARFESLRDNGGEGTNHWYQVVIKEGRNREVRRLFEALHLMVGRLIRVRFGALSLPPRLKRGQFIELTEDQIQSVLRWAGLTKSPVQRRPDLKGRQVRKPRTKSSRRIAKT